MSEKSTVSFVRRSILFLGLNTGFTWLLGLLAPSSLTLVFLSLGWILFGTYLLVRLVQQGHRWFLVLLILILAIIAIGVSMPVADFNQLLHPINEFLAEKSSPLAAGKIGHVICFAVLTFFLLRHRRHWKIGPGELFVVVTLLAVATEGIQLFIAGRTPKFVDFGLDALGVGIGAAVFSIAKIRKPGISRLSEKSKAQ